MNWLYILFITIGAVTLMVIGGYLFLIMPRLHKADAAPIKGLLFEMCIRDSTGGDQGSRQKSPRPQFYQKTAPRIRNCHFRRRQRSLPGTAAAFDHCQGHAAGPAHIDTGRGNQLCGHSNGTEDTKGLCRHDDRPHLFCHRPPPFHDQACGYHSGYERRRYCGTGNP